MKLELSAEEFLQLINETKESDNAELRIKNVGHFLENISDYGSREYELGTFIILNAKDFSTGANFNELHKKAETKYGGRKK